MLCKICHSASLQPLYYDLFDDRYGYPGKFSVWQCQQCGFAQIDPQLTHNQLDSLYTDYYPRKDITSAGVQTAIEYRSGNVAKAVRWLKGVNNTCHYHIRPNIKVLDVGCGSGTSLLEIKAQGAEAYGTELDRNVEPVAKQLHLQIHFGTFEAAHYPDKFFDIITMSQLLEHIPDPVDFLKTIRTKLVTQGTLLMSFPNINSVNRIRSGRKWINWHIPYHLNFFSTDSLSILAQQTGYQIKSIKTITPTVWMQLQLQANHYQALVGKPSVIWQPLTVMASKQSTRQRRWQIIKSIIISYLSIPKLRWQDAQGRGDSFLVEFIKPD